MRKEYDFSKARKNPYASMLKKPITIRLDEDSVSYFKAVSQEVGIPYRTSLALSNTALGHQDSINHLRAVFYLIKQKGYRYLCILNTVKALFVTYA